MVSEGSSERLVDVSREWEGGGVHDYSLGEEREDITITYIC